ncbi:hypothetical protein PIROE2DRAFT_65082 [Piromyces sp. E2]|nr:hypothetical protein PIROE2DRAFT_65082 [Piromyces sp. E2]|eukprot:OUM57300.1 hypothetical protein PIROE2DRAFT_65082 [Piromyces sp. E2]
MDTTTHTHLISCKNNSCETLAVDDTKVGYYPDASDMTEATTDDPKDKYNKLIQCSEVVDADGEVTGYSCSNVDSIIDGYYINAIANASDGLQESLIKCVTEGESPNTTSYCTIENASENDVYLNNDASDSLTIIQCYREEPVALETTGKGVCKGFTGTGTDDIPAYYLNAGSTGESLDDAIIVCNETSGCVKASTIPVENNVFFNANLKGTLNNKTGDDLIENPNPNDLNQLIVCGEETCEKITVNIANETDPALFYVNAGTYKAVIGDAASASDHFLIKCSYAADGTACSAATGALPTGITEQFYINGNYERDGSYVIRCNSTECTINTPNDDAIADDVEFYVNGAAEGFTGAIIKVSFTAPGTSRKRDDPPATDPPTITASCKLVDGKANDIYIDASTTTDQDLIQCYTDEGGDPSSVCASIAKMAGYFINADPDLSTDHYEHDLILCDNDGCGYVDGGDDKVFINTNFLVASINDHGDAENRLIICSGNECEAKNLDTSTTGNIFFVNGANESDDAYAELLIKCTGITACTPESGAEDSVYLNGNFNGDPTETAIVTTDTTHQLILCNDDGTDKKCTGMESTTTTYEYYINADFTNADSFDGALILFNVLSTPPQVTEVFYINGNYANDNNQKYLIQCTSEDTPGCTPYSSGATETAVEYYVHGGAEGYTDAVIKVTLTVESQGTDRRREPDLFKPKSLETVMVEEEEEEVTSEVVTDIFNEKQIFSLNAKMNLGLSGAGEEESDGVRIVSTGEEEWDEVSIATTATVKVSFDLIDGEDNDIYINASAALHLIQCQSTGDPAVGACASITVTGDDSIPLYYVNAGADPEKEDYEGRLIECKTAKCDYRDGSKNAVFINSNFKPSDGTGNGDTANRIIICSDDDSGYACLARNVSSSSKNKYFVNGAYESASGSFDHLVIMCEGDTACIPLTGIAEDAIYLNGNYHENQEDDDVTTDTENQLILCSSESSTRSCTAFKSDPIHYDYYINADYTYNASATSDQFANALIKCTKGPDGQVSCDEDTPGIDVSTVTELFYINGNYDHDDNKMYLIKCSSQSNEEGCRVAGTAQASLSEKTIEHYVHGGANGLTDAVIEVTTEENPTRKRTGTGYRAKPTLIEAVPVNSIYLNSSGNVLIQCLSTGCQSYTDSAWDNDKLKYYVNAALVEGNEFPDHLIKCSATAGSNCELIDGGSHNVYINSNHATAATDGDTENQLIICYDQRCRVEMVTLKEADHAVYYVNSGDYTDTDKYALIKCTYAASGTTCQPDKVTLGTETPTDVFYINNNGDKDGHYLIECSAINTCTIYINSGAVKNSIEHYVHGAPNGSDFTDAVIECPVTNVVLAEDGETVTGVTTNCTFVDTPEANFMYINSADGNLIQCYGTAECVAYSNVGGSDTAPVYYVNGNGSSSDTSYHGLLIECKGAGQCIEYDHGANHKVFINANYHDSSDQNANGDDTNRLIICNQDASDSKAKCELKNVTVGSGKKTFFANAAFDQNADYASLLIQCSESGACTSEAGGEDRVYLNGNFNRDTTTDTVTTDTVNQLIICNDGRCQVEKSKITEGYEYYIHANVDAATTALTEGLIKCEPNPDHDNKIECDVYDASLPAGVDSLFYINANGPNDLTKYLIICTSDDGCTGYANANEADGDVQYFVHGGQASIADGVIKCSLKAIPDDGNNGITGDCKFFEANVANNIFINGHDKNLIQCYSDVDGTTSTCVAVTTGALLGTTDIPTYFVNADDTVTVDSRIIECQGTGQCSPHPGDNEDVFFNGNVFDDTANANGEEDMPLIMCTAEECQTISSSVENGSVYYVNAGAYTDSNSENNKLIKCTNDGGGIECVNDIVKLSTGQSPETVYYINGNYVNGNYLLECVSLTECSPYGGERKPAATDVEHYVHGAVGDNGLTDAIIEVTFDSGSGSKKRSTDHAVPSLITGKDKYIYINSATDGIIQCQGDKCIPITHGYSVTFLDEQPSHYLNAALAKEDPDDASKIVSENDAYANLLIRCTATNKCQLMNGNAYDVFLNANFIETGTEGDTDHQLIVCSGGGGESSECQLTEIDLSTATNPSVNYYKNAGKYVGVDGDDEYTIVHPLILCTHDDSASKTTCAPESVTMGSGQPSDVFYINSNYGEDAPFDVTNYLIRCTTTEKCITYSSKSPIPNSNEYYVHGGQNAFADAVITCTVNEDSVVSDCKFVDTPAENTMYINSSGGNLIQCTNDSCHAFKGVVGSTGIPAYYVNGAGVSDNTDYTKLLIQCKGNGKCIEFGGEDDDFTNNVFLNSNYHDASITNNNPNPDGDTENRLIICSSNGTNASCQPTNIAVEEGSKYYLNGGSLNLKSYVNILIQCDPEGPCTLTNGANNNVYLNGNYIMDSTATTAETDDTYPLIICSDSFTDDPDVKCKWSESHLDDSDLTYEYYVNAGKYTDDTGLTYSLIRCDKDDSQTPAITCSHAEVSLGEGSTPEVFYINGNYGNDGKYVIRCPDHDNCFIYSNARATANSIEYYIHGAQTEFTDAIIQCEINEASTVEESCTFTEDTDAGFVYINSTDNNLIQCFTDDSSRNQCLSFDGVLGNNTVPAYFINGNPDNSESDYTHLLIKCTGSGKCSLFNGSDQGVYINSNFHDTSVTYTTEDPDPNPNGDDQRLIICQESQCTKPDITPPAGKNTYYMNAGAVSSKSSTYTHLLIQCPEEATAACVPDSAEEDNVYLNGNVDVDGFHLINCHQKECIGVAESVDKEVYYINSGASADTPLTDTLIKCCSDGCAEEDITGTVDGTTVTEVFYPNHNYGEQLDPVNYLIKCNVTEGCVPYGTVKPKETVIEHYIHGAQTELSDAVIRISFAKPTAKRAVNTVAEVTLVEDAEANDIYINSSDGQLIQCYDDGCSAYTSGGEEGQPVFYVNAENKNAETETYDNRLIRCDATCQEVGGKVNQVYLNANLLEANKNPNGDAQNQLIICQGNQCTATENAVEADKSEYYVNAGAYQANRLVDTLIECTNDSGITCTTKDISDKIDGGQVQELFYINKNYDTEHDAQNYVIKCDQGKGCVPFTTESTTTKTNEYFVHGGKTTTLDDSLIQCVFEEEGGVASCSTDQELTGAAEHQIYLNAANAQQIIRCTTSDGCFAADTAPTDKRSEFYMNGDDLAERVEDAGERKANSLIKCSINAKAKTKAKTCEVVSPLLQSTGGYVD